MHHEFAAATEGKAVDRRHRRHHRVLQPLRGDLKLFDEFFHFGQTARHQLIRHTDLARGFQRQRLRFLFEGAEHLAQRGRLGLRFVAGR